jgi:serine/threonine-protein kinase
VLEALASAETVRIVHRDVKPENIMQDPAGNYWLLDFGIARHLDLVSLTPTINAFGVGTPGYASPEQFRNMKRDIDNRSDLFALGVALFECVEGVNPLRDGARDNREILHRTETRPLPQISRSVDRAGGLSQLVLAMTRVHRDHRPATAAVALQWIREICAREGVV